MLRGFGSCGHVHRHPQTTTSLLLSSMGWQEEGEARQGSGVLRRWRDAAWAVEMMSAGARKITLSPTVDTSVSRAPRHGICTPSSSVRRRPPCRPMLRAMGFRLASRSDRVCHARGTRCREQRLSDGAAQRSVFCWCDCGDGGGAIEQTALTRRARAGLRHHVSDAFYTYTTSTLLYYWSVCSTVIAVVPMGVCHTPCWSAAPPHRQATDPTSAWTAQACRYVCVVTLACP